MGDSNHNGKGIYHCRQCDYPLFSSSAKFEAGFDKPTFWDVINTASIKVTDNKVFCNHCHTFLGKVYDDGPPEKTGKRYLIDKQTISLIQKTNGVKYHHNTNK